MVGEGEKGPALVFEASGEIVPIGPEGLVVGRSPRCSFRIDEPTVSKQHARLAREGRAVLLVDLGSTNGTHVNGVGVATAQLADGDHVRFGTASFRFRANAAPAREPVTEDRRITRALEAVQALSSRILEGERAPMRAATDVLLDVLEADRILAGAVRDGAEDGFEVTLIRTRPDLDPKRAVGPVPRSPLRKVLRSQKTYCPPAEVSGDPGDTSASFRAAGLGALVVVPLVVRGRILGALQVERLEGEPFDENEVLLAEIVANLIALTGEGTGKT